MLMHEVMVDGLHKTSSNVANIGREIETISKRMEFLGNKISNEWTGPAAKKNIPLYKMAVENVKKMGNLVGELGVLGGKTAQGYNKHEEELGATVQALSDVVYDKEVETAEIEAKPTDTVYISDEVLSDMAEFGTLKARLSELTNEYAKLTEKLDTQWAQGGEAREKFNTITKKVVSLNSDMDTKLNDFKTGMNAAFESYKTTK